MTSRSKVLGMAYGISMCALALVPAHAEDFSGVLSGAYAHDDSGEDIWGGKAALTIPLGGDWGIEADGSYHNASSTDFWSIGGSPFFRFEAGRIAATAIYHDVDGAHLTNYGAGGEWYAAPNFTLAVRGGGTSGSGSSGGYVGGQGSWYVTPDIALSGDVDYIDVAGNATSETIKAEWLFASSLPLSLYGGYQHVDSVGSANVWFIGLKFYGGDGGATLVDHQREGSLGYIGESPFFIDQY